MEKLELEKMVKEKELELEQLKKELELEQLKKEFEKVNKVGLVFEPKLNEKYYWVDMNGYINYYINDNHDLDEYILKNKLVYPTRELAEKARDRQQAKIRVIKEIARLNDGWIPNWEDSEKYKYFVYYNAISKKIYDGYTINNKHLDNNLHLKSKGLAERLIETHREDLLLMLEVE